MIDMIDQETYNEEVLQMGKDIAQECFDDGGYDLYDMVHERVDSHQWIIYYRHNLAILDFSGNSNAIFDQGMQDSLKTVDNFQKMVQLFAYWAMYQDVSELAEEHYQELEDKR